MKWFKNRFYYVLEIFDKKFKKYKFDESLIILYKLIWDDFCSWYLEIIKPIIGQLISEIVYFQTIKWFELLLKLIHPYMPFISEEIWHLLKKRTKKEALIISSWPKRKSFNKDILLSFERATKIISKIRFIRNKMNFSYKKSLVLYSMKKEKEYCSVIIKLANLSKIIHLLTEPKDSKLVTFFVGSERFFLSIQKNDFYDKIDIMNIQKKIHYFYNLLYNIRKNLSNKKYVQSVSKEIFLKEKKKESDIIKKITSLKEFLKKN